MKSKAHGLQKEMSETKEVKSQLEHQQLEVLYTSLLKKYLNYCFL